MSPKLVPSNPEAVMVIREVVPGITTLSVPFARVGLINMGGRGTIVKMTSGGLAVFSPVALTPTVKKTVEQLGEVKYLIAPDIEHHIFLSAWAAAYPSAHIIAPEGLPEKRAKQNLKDKSVTILPFGTVFTAKNKESITVTPDFDADFAYEFLESHPNKELVFFHRPTKTLVEADLLFNLPATEQYSKSDVDPTAGFIAKLANGLWKTSGDAIWQKRLIWLSLSKDRASSNKSIAKINSWDFENLIPCHGDSLVGNGKTIFEKVFEWHLKSKK